LCGLNREDAAASSHEVEALNERRGLAVFMVVVIRCRRHRGRVENSTAKLEVTARYRDWL